MTLHAHRLAAPAGSVPAVRARVRSEGDDANKTRGRPPDRGVVIIIVACACRPTFRAGRGRGTRAGAAGGQAARAGGHDGALGLDAAVLSWWRPPDTCALVLGGDGHAVLPAKPCVNGVVWTRERHHPAEPHLPAKAAAGNLLAFL